MPTRPTKGREGPWSARVSSALVRHDRLAGLTLGCERALLLPEDEAVVVVVDELSFAECRGDGHPG